MQTLFLKQDFKASEIPDRLNQAETVCIIATFFMNEKRRNTMAIAAKQLLLQERDFPIIHIDLDDWEASLPVVPLNMPDYYFVRIQPDVQNRDLFQKECLYNIAAQKIAPLAKTLIFLDADLYSENSNWLKQYADLVRRSEYSLVQGYRFCIDTHSQGNHSQSFISFYNGGTTSDLMLNPGATFGVSRSFYDAIGGFKTIFPDTRGDLFLLLNHLPKRNRIPFEENYRQFEKYFTASPADLVLSFLAQDIRHVFHGKHRFRQYYEVARAVDEENIEQLITTNPLTMLNEWQIQNANCRKVIAQITLQGEEVLVDNLLKAG